MADDLVPSDPIAVISRSEAKAAGLKHYYTGKPCQRGHIDRRYTKSGACMTCARGIVLDWQREHREQCIAKCAAYRKANLEALREKDRAYCEANREMIRERQRAWRAARPGYDLRKSNEYHEANPGRRKVYRLRQLAKLRNVEGTSTPEQINAIYEMQKGKCAICKKSVGLDFHIDHIIPISRGGTNWPSNLQVTCRGCNCSKKGADPIEHMQSLGFLL